jgi:hypothetical protein
MRMTVALNLPPNLSIKQAALPRITLVCRPDATVQQMITVAIRQLASDDDLWRDIVDVEKLIEQVDVIEFAGSPPEDAELGFDGILFGLDPNGRLVVANESFSNITIGDVARARKDRLLEGDITQPILHCIGRSAASLAESWAYFLVAVGTLKFLADAAQAANDMRRLGGLLNRRTARRYASRFGALGVAPRHLVRLIRRRKYWDTAKLAHYLDITAEDAAQLLIAAGYRYAPEGSNGSANCLKASSQHWRKWLCAVNRPGSWGGVRAGHTLTSPSPGTSNERDHGTVGAHLPPRIARPDPDLEPAASPVHPPRIRNVLQRAPSASRHRQRPTTRTTAQADHQP